MTAGYVKELRGLLDDCNQRLWDIDRENKAEAIEHFQRSRGCETCAGRGWVVMWDTLDCMQGSYAQYGACPEDDCSEFTRSISGLLPRNSKYDRNRGAGWQPTYAPDDLELRSILISESTRLQGEIAEEVQKWTPLKGKVAKVIKAARGRKDRRVPVGVSGIIEKIFTNSWGKPKAIMIDEDGKKWWPNVDQLEVTDPAPDSVSWGKVQQDEREKNGFPVIGTIKKKTGRAALVKLTTGQEFWIPQSQVPEISSFKEKTAAAFSLPFWLAEKNGLIRSDK